MERDNGKVYMFKELLELELTKEEVGQVYFEIEISLIPDEVSRELDSLSFSFWAYDKPVVLLLFLEYICNKMCLTEYIKYDQVVLKKFLIAVMKNYNENPYHNFQHCFCVTHMMYYILNHKPNHGVFNQFEKTTLILSAICHDLGHPGTNNMFQKKTNSKYYQVYRESSTLEKLHFDVCKNLIKGNMLLNNMDEENKTKIMTIVNRMIMATDMELHKDIVERFENILNEKKFDISNSEHKLMLMELTIKACDISNESRPFHVTEPWVNCLLNEFFNQGDLEEKLGLPVNPLFDRNKTVKVVSQVNFMKFVSIPLIETLNKVIDVNALSKGLKINLSAYEKLKQEYEVNVKK